MIMKRSYSLVVVKFGEAVIKSWLCQMCLASKALRMGLRITWGDGFVNSALDRLGRSLRLTRDITGFPKCFYDRLDASERREL